MSSSAEYQRQWYKNNPGKRRQYYLAHHEKHLEQERERARIYHEANKETIKKRKHLDHIKRVYGITEDALQALYEVQHGKCAICQQEFSDERTPNVDHDHEDGRIRGLLCRDCNIMLGFAHDSQETLQRATSYLGR